MPALLSLKGKGRPNVESYAFENFAVKEDRDRLPLAPLTSKAFTLRLQESNESDFDKELIP
jgi:hypothetical protein